jgi:hypothetical protein
VATGRLWREAMSANAKTDQDRREGVPLDDTMRLTSTGVLLAWVSCIAPTVLPCFLLYTPYRPKEALTPRTRYGHREQNNRRYKEVGLVCYSYWWECKPSSRFIPPEEVLVLLRCTLR